MSKSLAEALTSKLLNKKIHAVETCRNGAKLNYIHPLWFYQKSLTDSWKGEPCEIHNSQEKIKLAIPYEQN